MSHNIFETREEWLNAAVTELRSSFIINGAELPQAIRVSCALPSNARRSGAIGECFADTASSDKHYEIFISPTLAEPTRVLDVLIHELCHTTKGAFNHGTAFQRIAADMLLVPTSNSSKPWKSTGQALTFIEAYHGIIQALGEYPHGELSLATRKVQSTRMLKAVCPACDYTIRLTAKWAYDASGNPRLPSCPCGSHFTL
jgi:hypothetical protein